MPNVNIYKEQGGDRQVVASGASLDVESGGDLDIESGASLKLAGTAITSTAAELNILDTVTATAAELNYNDITTAGTSEASKSMVRDSSNEMDGIPIAESQSVDPSQKVTFLDDFLAAAIEARISSTAGSGTGNEAATKVANSTSGEITLKSASDDGAHSANGTSLTLDETNFRADQGGLAVEARIKIDDITSVAIFVGLTDVISTTVELPIFLNAGDIDSDAANACGIIFDTDATTDEWCHGGVKADADTTPAFSGSAPVNATYVILRVEVSATGGVRGYINGTAIGAEVASAVTATTSLTPVIVVANRSAAQRILTIDYFWAQQDR